MNIHEVIVKVARAYNNLDYREIEQISSENIVYTSQSVLSSLNGKKEVIQYLKEKFETIKNSKDRVFAEIANIGSQKGWTIQIPGIEGKPCILLSQGKKENKGGLILIEVNNSNLLEKIDICTVAPHWSTAIGTDVYPS